MALLFANQAGQRVFASLRQVFEEKRVYYQKQRFIVFVCGGKLGEEDSSLRKQFIEWAAQNLPEFICLIAEEALKDSFAGEGLTFVNLATFESIVADVADCVLIFPESPGSFAEVGFFANSEVGHKTLVVNPLSFQAEESFLNLGPIDTINSVSLLKPTVLINADDFSQVGQRLKERVKRSEHPTRLPYQKFGQFNFKEKLLVVFEIVRLLQLAELTTIRHALKDCFGGNPKYQKLKHLLRILLAAGYVQRATPDAQYFKVTAGLKLVEIEHLEVERVFAQVLFFYQKHARELYEVLSGVGQ